ncbi:UNVERIFIED_CONTAM: hypothetical protein GTU68_042056 [Idotea baltica]|nr:hypothetical protein [Idotea baltica]
MEQATVFNDDPAAQALSFQNDGCEWLHLVDLNGAFAGVPVNAAPVEAILSACNVPAQLGGGIRDIATIENWLAKGLQRVILGTVAVENPDLVREAAAKFPGHVAVGIDARAGMVATRGWAEETDIEAKTVSPGKWEIFTHGGRKGTGIDAVEFAKLVASKGAGEILLTSMDRDGTRDGYNLPLTRAISDAVNIPVIASGGVGNLDHLVEGVTKGGASAVLAASIFHFGDYTIKEAKEYMQHAGVPVRI